MFYDSAVNLSMFEKIFPYTLSLRKKEINIVGTLFFLSFVSCRFSIFKIILNMLKEVRK